MSRFTCNEHLCKSVSGRMGAPFLSTTLVFFVYQILQFGNISGLPFASISSIPSVSSLKTPKTLPSDESPVTSTITSNLVNSEISSPVSGTLSSQNFQLFIGSPDVNSVFFTSLHPSVINNVSNGQTLSADASDINFLTSSNMQSSVLPSNFASELETTSDLDSNLFISPTLTSGLSTFPTINIDFNSNNFKRELRDTLSQEPCLLNSQSTNNFQSPFSIVPSFANLKPIIPCVACRLPVNFTESSTQNNAQKFNCQDSNKLSNVINSNVASSVSIDSRPCITPLKNDLMNSCENRNSVKFNNMCNNRNVLQNKPNIAQDNSKSCSSGEIINTGQASSSPFNTLSSIATLKNYVNSKQNLQSCSNSENLINQPIIEMNSSPNQFNQLNSNFQLAQAMNNNKILSQQTQKLINSEPNTEQISQNTMAECDDLINQRNRLAAEYENVLRIRNNVIPQMLSNNVRVKNSPQNNIKNNDNSGCPQLQTVSVNNDVPFIRNSSPLPANNCGCDNNSGSTGFITLNNMARNMKDSQDNKYIPQNNNQGCPQLMSIPIYNKESLLNKQLARLSSSNNECSQNKNVNNDQALVLSDNNVNFNNNKLTINQNSQECPQLLALAQNNLYANKNNNVNVNLIINKQDCDSLEELTDSVNFNNYNNCIQTPLPNDNLAQAIKLMSRSKNQPAQVSEGTINVLPYGRALLDGKPLPNSYISLDSVANPEGIQPSTSTDLCNSNKFLTIQDVSSIPFSSAPVNQFPCVTPQDTSVSMPTNIMMAPSFPPITAPPVATNILPIVLNLSPSAPKIASYTTGPCNQPLANSFYNNNIQPILNFVDNNLNYPLTSTTSCVSPLISSDSVLIQSPQLSFINSVPSSTLNDNSVSLSNLPPVYASPQPVNSPPYINHVITALPQCNSIQDISVAYPSLNNVVSSITQNILSNLITSLPSTGAPLLELPPVNSLCSTVVTDSLINSPVCFDISQQQYLSSPLCLPGPSLPAIPVACNEYLPPVYNSAFLPMTFNSGLFCGESDEAVDSCSPFYISNTDAYYPEISFMAPTVASSDCSRLCGPLFMPASSLPQSSPVLKINNTGREAKGFEQLIGCLTL